jgi:hypothetical protein
MEFVGVFIIYHCIEFGTITFKDLTVTGNEIQSEQYFNHLNRMVTMYTSCFDYQSFCIL